MADTTKSGYGPRGAPSISRVIATARQPQARSGGGVPSASRCTALSRRPVWALGPLRADCIAEVGLNGIGRWAFRSGHLRGLDEVNLLFAGVLWGFAPTSPPCLASKIGFHGVFHVLSPRAIWLKGTNMTAGCRSGSFLRLTNI
jgi:hypothetical protein